MKIPQIINSYNYKKCTDEFVSFFVDIGNNEVSANEALLRFSIIVEATFPENLKNLDSLKNFFSGNKSRQFLSWYHPFVEIWKEYQALSLPFSSNLLDSEYNQKIDTLFRKLKKIYIEYCK